MIDRHFILIWDMTPESKVQIPQMTIWFTIYIDLLVSAFIYIFLVCNDGKSDQVAPKCSYEHRVNAIGTVNVVIFAGGKFRENVGKTFHVGVIFTIHVLH